MVTTDSRSICSSTASTARPASRADVEAQVRFVCRERDLSVWTAANSMANLVERGLITPMLSSIEQTALVLRQIASASRPGARA